MLKVLAIALLLILAACKTTEMQYGHAVGGAMDAIYGEYPYTSYGGSAVYSRSGIGYAPTMRCRGRERGNGTFRLSCY